MVVVKSNVLYLHYGVIVRLTVLFITVKNRAFGRNNIFLRLLGLGFSTSFF